MIIRPKVIARIQSDLSGRFRVVDNTGTDKKLVAGQFPDVILYKKQEVSPSEDILFILKIENGGELIDSLSAWKELSAAPSTFYIVVPITKLDDAKKLANATGVKARFASYETKDDEVVMIRYE